MNKNNYITNLAREAIENYIISGKEVEINEAEVDNFLKKPAGVFVTLKKENELRGCMGTFRPVQKNAAYEIVSNAMTAAENDPRFPAVQKEELSQIEISVDILSDPEKISSEDDLDPKKYGVLVQGGHQTGLLLPELEGIDTVEKQINVARKKAGLASTSEIEIYRFTVSRFKEND